METGKPKKQNLSPIVEPKRVAEWRIDTSRDFRPWSIARTRINRQGQWTAVGLVVTGAAFYLGGAIPLAIYTLTLPMLPLFNAYVTRQADEEMRRLVADPSPAEQFPVDIEVWTSGYQLGEDRGVAFFSEGWLNFEGIDTWFSFSKSDTVGVYTNRRDSTLRTEFGGDAAGALPIRVIYEVDGRIFILAMRCRESFTEKEPLYSLPDTFMNQFLTWSGSPTKRLGEEIMPPVLPHQMRPYFAFRSEALMNLYAIVGVVFFLRAFSYAFLDFFMSIALATVLIIFFAGARRSDARFETLSKELRDRHFGTKNQLPLQTQEGGKDHPVLPASE